MAKTRMINTKFWSDNFISGLNPLDRYLFLYFLTNEHTNIAGVYELPLKTMASETGIDKDMLPRMIQRLKGKVFYCQGWIGIKNFQKHQSTTSEKIQKGIEIEMSKIPPSIKEKMDKLYGIDTLSDPIIYSNSNSNSNSNLNIEPIGIKKTKFNPLGAKIIKAFEAIDPKNKNYYNITTQRKACDFLLQEYGLELVLKVITILPEANTKKLYIAQITTPYELQQNWIKLKNAINSTKLSNNKIQKI